MRVYVEAISGYTIATIWMLVVNVAGEASAVCLSCEHNGFKEGEAVKMGTTFFESG